MQETFNKRIFFAATAVGTLVYVALRLRGYADSCLWFDEIFSVHAAGMPWGSMLPFVAMDIVHPPLSYILLKFWMLVEPSDIRWLRLFPLFISVLTLLPIAVLMHKMKLGPAAVLTVLLFLAFNGTLIKYAQEVRMYSLLFCLSAFSAWAFLRFLKMGKGFVALIIVNALMVYTHYFGWFIVLGEVLAVAIWQRIKLRRTLLMLGIDIALFLPWGLYVYSKVEGMDSMRQSIGWQEAPGFSALVGFFFDLTEPVYFQASSAEAATYWPFSVPVLIACVGLVASLAYDWKNKSQEDRNTALRLTLMFGFPIVCAFVLSVASPLSIWGTRHLLVSAATLSMLMGFALNSLRAPLLRGGVATLLVLLFVGALVADHMRPERRYLWCGWNSFAKGMDKTGGKVYLFEDLAAYQFWFSKEDPSLQVYLVEDAEDMREDKAYFLPRGFEEVRKVSESEITGDEFFLAYAAESFDDTKAPLKKLRARGYRFSEPQIFDTGRQRSFLVRVRRE